MSRQQNAGRNHNKRTDNGSFERVKQFEYSESTITNQNSIQEEIKSRLKSGTVSYHSVQNLLSSSLLSKNVKIKIHRTVNKIYRTINLGVYSCTDGSRNYQSFLLWCAVCSSYVFFRLERSLLRWRRTVIESITADMLQTVWNKLDYRDDVCRIIKGAHTCLFVCLYNYAPQP